MTVAVVGFDGAVVERIDWVKGGNSVSVLEVGEAVEEVWTPGGGCMEMMSD